MPQRSDPSTELSSPAIQRRMLRLRSLFEPYRFLNILFAESASEPVSLVVEEKAKRRNYTVKIWRRLVNEKSPDWLEYALLNCARALVHDIERGLDVLRSAKQTESYKQLAALYHTLAPPPPSPVPMARATTAPTDPIVLTDEWRALQERFFPDRADLLDYRVRWSNRKQRSCLASCNVEKRTVNIAQLFEQVQYHRYISPLMYHEMCHAVLGKPEVRGGRRIFHGREFKALEKRHPEIPMLDAWVKSGEWHAAARHWRRSQGQKRRLRADARNHKL